MNPNHQAGEAEFDRYAEYYDQALNEGLAASGEPKDFFARKRVAWLAECLRKRSAPHRQVMDYGCGTGQTSPHLLKILAAEKVVGVDVSEGLLGVARRKSGMEGVEFLSVAQRAPAGDMDVVYCNGVFHHIPPPERTAAFDYVFRSLRPGGIFALWDNNPWNPGTRYVMSRIPFDSNANLISPPHARQLLRASGFEILTTHYLFIFPHWLRWLRWIEPRVCRLPLGAQYQVLARKP